MESFEITDYDLDNEFNVNRPRRKLTKQQQMLGIWADDSDEEQPTARQSKHFNKGPKNYTAPVNFVAGGIQQSTKNKPDRKKDGEEDESGEEEEEEENQDKDDDTQRPRRGDDDYVPNSSRFDVLMIVIEIKK